jgi:hypothetical protein
MQGDPTMKNTTKTAATDYSQRAAITQDLLKRIAARLSEHRARHVAQPGDWSYAGDLDRVNEELTQVLAALGDRSGIQELGLKY